MRIELRACFETINGKTNACALLSCRDVACTDAALVENCFANAIWVLQKGYSDIPPNNYPFYGEEEKYKPLVQSDGGVLSDWKELYNPTPEQAEEDRQKAYESGVPHGYVPEGDKYAGDEKMSIMVKSLLHEDSEYGAKVRSRRRLPFKFQLLLL